MGVLLKAISFSLFGTAPIYLQGALRNAEQYPKLFPGWTCVFYIEVETVPYEIALALSERGAALRSYSLTEYPNGMFPRFLISDDPKVERFIVRDCDSRPSQREVNAVNAWIESGTDGHIMRDHPWHQSLMMGGSFGGKGAAFRGIEAAMKKFPRTHRLYTREKEYGADQDFLNQFFYPRVRKSGVIHDSCCRHIFHDGIDFPDPLIEGDFVGSIYDEEDKPNLEHLKVRNEYVRLRNQEFRPPQQRSQASEE